MALTYPEYKVTIDPIVAIKVTIGNPELNNNLEVIITEMSEVIFKK